MPGQPVAVGTVHGIAAREPAFEAAFERAYTQDAEPFE